jgi:hypothetical protein
MTRLEYNSMSETDQLDLLYEKGVFIGKRKNGVASVLLYQLEGFYVEVYYKKHRQFANKILSFTNTTVLDPYLDQIAVEQNQ